MINGCRVHCHMEEDGMSESKPGTENPKRPRRAGSGAMGDPVALGTAAAQAWMDMGTEAVRFVWDRMQQDIKTQQAMLACTSLEELQRIQAEFFTAAQEQYAAEAGRMLERMGKAVASGLTAVSTARRYDDVPL
mgnify:CR=1 FL=1